MKKTIITTLFILLYLLSANSNAEVSNLVGNSAKAKSKLGWKPKTNIYQLVDEMIEEDLAKTEQDYIYK